MDISKKNNSVEEIVGKNVKSLRIQSRLTVDGLAIAIETSVSYVKMIEKGKANISSIQAKKIANFFNIEVSQLYSDKKVKLFNHLKIQPITDFYKEHERNPKYFIDRKSEYKLPAFIKEYLLKDPFLKTGREISEIKNYCFEVYKREFTSAELSREFRRLHEKGDKVGREDKFGNGSVYKYFFKNEPD